MITGGTSYVPTEDIIESMDESRGLRFEIRDGNVASGDTVGGRGSGDLEIGPCSGEQRKKLDSVIVRVCGGDLTRPSIGDSHCKHSSESVKVPHVSSSLPQTTSTCVLVHQLDTRYARSLVAQST